ncbi:MAG: DUF433 domain-containing protein [Planctomycetia bacterium]|nr:DUF433 domain-containing protein [Planctomycetia bacterium]
MSAAVSYPHVVFTPSMFQGEPHIEGLRIRVWDVVLARDQGGYTPEEIAATVYPDLSLAQVYSALAYFEDHRVEIEQAVRREQDAIEEFRKTQSHLLTDRSA